MEKCKYINLEYVKVLIPHCWAVAISNDISRCTCRNYPKTVAQFERQKFNDILEAKNREIRDLEKENARLKRTIKNLID